MKECGYWNIEENLINEAKKYSSRTEFCRKNKYVYNKAKKRGIIDRLPWLTPQKHPSGYWYIKEHVFEEGRKYSSRNEFKKGCDRAYTVAKKKGWIDEMEWLLPKDNVYKAGNYVYVYLDDEYNVAYVGITCNKINRHKNHSSGTYNKHKIKSSVYSFFNSVDKEVPQPLYLEEGLSRREAQIKEYEWVQYYKSNGYTMLNRARTGLGCSALGHVSMWDFDSFMNEAKKYKTTTELRKYHERAYYVGKENDWLKFTNLIDTSTPKPYLTIEECFKEALKCNSIQEIIAKSRHIYTSCIHNKCMEEIKNEFKKRRDEQYKTKVLEISKRYSSLKEYKRNETYYYHLCKKNQWLKEMVWLNDDIPTTKEKVFNISRKYQYLSDFKRNAIKSYKIAKDNGWLEEMGWLGCRPRYSNLKWTFDIIIELAKNVTYNKHRFAKEHEHAYRAAVRNKWLKLIPFVTKDITKDEIFAVAKKCNSRSEFCQRYNKEYLFAKNNKWLDDLFPKYKHTEKWLQKKGLI